MQLEKRQIHQVVEQVWEAVLGWEVVETDAPTPAGLTGHVPINGDWQGAVVLRCDPELARRAAAAMFGRDAADVTPAEIDDALGELANIVGGNLRPLLPPINRLGLPSVAVLPNGRIVLEASFRTFDHPFDVAVLEL